jgi:RES domain-containing protein
VTTLWRLTRRIHAARQTLADGARLTGGRWNPCGVPVVYAGSSIALVALEYFVHLSGDEPSDLVLLEIEVPDDASVQPILPKDSVGGRPGRDAGAGTGMAPIERWLMLWVPSAIVPEQRNALLNPLHPQWERVEVRILRPFHFDRRMYKA